MKKQSSVISLIINLFIGLGVTAVLQVILLLIIAFIGSRDGVPESFFISAAIAAAVISIFIGAFVSGVRNRRSGLVVGAMHSVGWISLVVIVSLVVRGGNADIFGLKLLAYLVLGTVLSALGAVLGVNFRRSRA